MTLFVLMSHRLGEDQVKEARGCWGVQSFHHLPEELQATWSRVDPAGPLNIEPFRPILAWLEGRAVPGDLVLVQGEYGLTVFFVLACWRLGLRPLYAASERVYEEERGPNGTILRRHCFRHVNFREYLRGENG